MFYTGYLFLDILLYLILISKLSLTFLTIFKRFILRKNIISEEVYKKIYFITKNFFEILMPILLIILFNPITSKYMIINNHTKIFLFVFGVLELIYKFTEN